VDQPHFSWRGLTDSPADQLTGYRVYWGPDPLGTGPYTDTVTAAYTVTQPVGSGAEYFLRLQARDAAGHWSDWATLFDFRFDNTPPALDAWLPADGAVITDTRPVITAAYSDLAPGSSLAAPVLAIDQQIVTPTLAAGALTYRPEAPLAPGAHTLTLYLADQAGNQTSATRRFTLDPETQVRVLSPAEGAVLNTRSPAVVVAGEPGAAVTVTVAGQAFTHTLDASGRWEIPDIEFDEGDNVVSATATDQAGNTAGDAVTVTVDLTADVSLVAAERVYVNPAQAPALFAITALAGGGRQVLSWSLTLEAGAATVAVITGTQPAEHQPIVWDGRLASSDLAPDGAYTARLTLTTTGGRVTQSAALAFTLASDPPAAPTLECGVDNETWFSQPPALVRGTAPEGVQVVVAQGGVDLFVVPVFAGRWQQPLALSQGAPFSTTVTARTLDAAGNSSIPSAPCLVGLTQSDPFVAPHASLSQAILGLGNVITLSAATRAIGAPLNADGVQVALPVELGTAPVLTRTDGTAAADTWSGVWHLPDAGQWEAPVTVVFSAVDTAQPAPNRGVQFVQPYLDLVPPYARLMWPWAGYAQNAAALTPQGVAEPFSLVTVTAFRVSDGLALSASGTSDATGAWTTSLTLPDGRYTLSVQARDQAGNVGPASELIVITIDTTGPALQSLGLWPKYVDVASELTVTLSVTDALSAVADISLRIDDLQRVGDSVMLDLAVHANTATGALAIAEDAEEGLKPVTVFARDTLNNTAVLTGAAVIVDQTPPILSDPTLTANATWLVITGTTAYHGPQTQGQMSVAVSAEDASATHMTAGLETLTFPAFFGAPEERRPLDGARASLTYTRTYTVTGTTNGAFPVLVTDRAGNSADRALTLHYDAAPPTVTVSLPPVAGLRFSVGWAALDQAAGVESFEVQYRDAGELAWTAWLTGTTETINHFHGQAGRSYVFRVRATDRVGNVSAWQTATAVVADVVKYYTFAGQRLAMRQGLAVHFIHGDHLGSAALVTDAAGAVVAETRYLPYGLERASAGASPTDFSFTGQRQDGFGLLDYNARFYAPQLGQFISADTIVPGADNPQRLNRYAYSLSNPLKYIDPSGHVYLCAQACEEEADRNWKPLVDPVPLTLKGTQMLALCQEYYGGNCNTQDFLARGLTPEFKTIDLRRNPDAERIVQQLEDSTTYSLYQKCRYEKGGPCTSLSQNAVMNWMGGFSSTSYDMYERWRGGMSAQDAVNQNINPLAALVAAHAMSAPDPVLGVANTSDLPASWGNRSLYAVPVEVWGGSIESALTVQGLGQPLWSYGLPGQNTFLIFSVKQVNFLQQFRVK